VTKLDFKNEEFSKKFEEINKIEGLIKDSLKDMGDFL